MNRGASHGPPLVLLVDDDIALLDALPHMLKLRLPQATINTCDSGPAALEHIIAKDYHVIISDVKMPGTGGIGLLREASRIRPLTPFILITGHGDAALAAEALGLGAYLFIQKPLDRDAFALSVQRALEAYDLRTRIESQETISRDLPQRDSALTGLILYIEGLPAAFTADELKKLFLEYDAVLWTRLVTDLTHYARVFGYVEMATPTGAGQAVQSLDGHQVAGHTIRVSIAETPSHP